MTDVKRTFLIDGFLLAIILTEVSHETQSFQMSRDTPKAFARAIVYETIG